MDDIDFGGLFQSGLGAYSQYQQFANSPSNDVYGANASPAAAPSSAPAAAAAGGGMMLYILIGLALLLVLFLVMR